jgi:RES domain-containing protein
MRLWRLSKHAAFDGEGARRHGARWSSPGVAVVYAAASLALAMLEFIVRLDRSRDAGTVFVHYADVPDDASVETLREDRLPNAWDAYPAPVALRDIGTSWALSRASALLSVPSAVLRVNARLVPAERNYLLNPAHPEFARIRVRSVSVQLDPRTWR